MGLTQEAEVRAVSRVIHLINSAAHVYLAQMFDDPITVRMSTSRKLVNGKTKFQITSVVEYGGQLYPKGVKSLSGGERQRCNLAFILAVNDLVGGKFLFLDECLNHLDAEVNTDILTRLRQAVGQKTVLVVSHEAVRGVFDSIVKV